MMVTFARESAPHAPVAEVLEVAQDLAELPAEALEQMLSRARPFGASGRREDFFSETVRKGER